MSDVDTATLWLIFGQIGEQWNNGQYCDMPQAQFAEAIARQVGLDPSYIGYYNAAVSEYQTLLEQCGGNQQQALQILFQQNQVPIPPSPNVSDIANYVLLEFMRWQVAFGGFRAFGYENYNGWMGGGSFLQVPPPYRALNDE